MSGPSLTRRARRGVTFLGDATCPHGVSLAFTERHGGVSTGDFSSLNLGDACGDDPAAVAENRLRALAALGAEGLSGRLVNPRQVHGDHVVVVTSSEAAELASVRNEAGEGADAVVCTAAGVPVLLCYADCVPVVLVAEGGFAVIHSGWRGTVARISAKALATLATETGHAPQEVRAYVGPHIAGEDYEVSAGLMGRFVDEFGPAAQAGERLLDLEACIVQTLVEEGVPADMIAGTHASTSRETGRFFSYRATGGSCGRHGALVVMSDR